MTQSSVDLHPNLERLRSARRRSRGPATLANLGSAVVGIDDDIAPHTNSDGNDNQSHRFAVGHMVQFIGPQGLIAQAPGTYEVMAQVPERDGEPQYRVKSTLEAYQRVVREGLIEAI